MDIRDKIEDMINCYSRSNREGDEGDYNWRKYLSYKKEIVQEFEKLIEKEK